MGEKSYADRPLLDKLGVRPGMRVSVLGKDAQDPEFLAALAERVPGFSLGIGLQESDAVFIVVQSPWDHYTLSSLRYTIKPDGAIWAVFRKGQKDFNETHVRMAGLEAGFVDVKVVRFSETHTALKFVIRKAER